MSKLLGLISLRKQSITNLKCLPTITKYFSNGGGGQQISESTLTELLKTRFKNAQEIKVLDVSGGCGAMFEIYVASSEFKGLSIVKQHKTITDTLKEQIKQIHGLRIETKAA